MGIPVDGSRTRFEKELEHLGFRHQPPYDYLRGVFNGKSSIVSVYTTNRKVSCISVMDSRIYNEKDIKARFNSIVRQFESQDNYIPGPIDRDQQFIADDVDIDRVFNISSRNFPFQAEFYQKPIWDLVDINEYNQFVEDRLLDYSSFKCKNNPDNPKLSEDDSEEIKELASEEFMFNIASKKVVWLVIDKSGLSRYRIVYFYKNLYNEEVNSNYSPGF